MTSPPVIVIDDGESVPTTPATPSGDDGGELMDVDADEISMDVDAVEPDPDAIVGSRAAAPLTLRIRFRQGEVHLRQDLVFHGDRQPVARDANAHAQFQGNGDITRRITLALSHDPIRPTSLQLENGAASPAPANFRSLVEFRRRDHDDHDEHSSMRIRLDDGFEAAEWKAAARAELAVHIRNHTWDIVRRPPGAKVIGQKWVFGVKVDANDNITRYKARLAALGFLQTPGVDHMFTYSPVAS
ncbi:hypothetical protein ON010_g15661 [Phytophthora cinnamomi]|nr:hypothetical protein ON010_g15661 [Phytophthora cinnamomi]